jgi:hypothetical protein
MGDFSRGFSLTTPGERLDARDGTTLFIVLSGITAPGGHRFSGSPLDGPPFEGNRLIKLSIQL